MARNFSFSVKRRLGNVAISTTKIALPNDYGQKVTCYYNTININFA